MAKTVGILVGIFVVEVFYIPTKSGPRINLVGICVGISVKCLLPTQDRSKA